MIMRKRVASLLDHFWNTVIRSPIPVSDWLRTKTLGLGLINFSLFAIAAITGILLAFYYVPHPQNAYQDLKDLQFAVAFGSTIRNMHHWAAYLMIVSVFLHMCRAFFMGEYYAPRQFNWVIGVLLLLITLGFGLTGSYLPWDQKAYWGITIMSNITASVPFLGEKLKYAVLGGTEVGENALLRLYVVHTKVLPVLLLLVAAVHFFKIWKDDLLAGSGAEQVAANPVSASSDQSSEDVDATWLDIITRESCKFLLILAIVMILALFFDAPLEEQANAAVTPNPVKAVWFFVGIQEVLSWGAPFWFGVVIPNFAIVGLMLIPYLDRGPAVAPDWFHPSRRWQNILFTAFVTIVIGLIIIGQFIRGPGWVFYWPWQPWPTH